MENRRSSRRFEVVVLAILAIALAGARPSQAAGMGGHGGGAHVAAAHPTFAGHPAFNGHHGDDGHRFHPWFRGSFAVAPVFPFYGYAPGYYPGYPSTYVDPAPTYYWYCPSYGAYYPSVGSCPEDWVPVPAS